MPDIKMLGEHKVEITFNSSHACSFWIKQFRRMFETKDFDDVIFASNKDDKGVSDT